MTNSLAAATALSREPEAGSTLNVLGVTHIYKVTGAETGGSLSFWEAVIPPGAGRHYIRIAARTRPSMS